MEKFLNGRLSGVTRKIGDAKRDGLGLKHKTKARKYNETFLSLGFTVTQVDGVQRPRCVICLKTLAADSLKPCKLKRHLKSFHPGYQSKPLDFFERKLDGFRNPESSIVVSSVGLSLTGNSKAQMASYQVAYRIAKCKKQATHNCRDSFTPRST